MCCVLSSGNNIILILRYLDKFLKVSETLTELLTKHLVYIRRARAKRHNEKHNRQGVDANANYRQYHVDVHSGISPRTRSN